MKEKEYLVKAAEASVRTAESRLTEAKRALEHGIRRAQAEYDRELNKLNAEVERCRIELDREREYLKWKMAEKENNFES